MKTQSEKEKKLDTAIKQINKFKLKRQILKKIYNI